MTKNNNKILESWQISDIFAVQTFVDACRNEQTNEKRGTQDSAHNNSEGS